MFANVLASSIFALSLGKTIAAVTFRGINIAGFDFGTQTDGSCTMSNIYGPVESLRYGNNPDGIGQMNHFSSKDGFNIFRLPVAWQFLVDSPGASLDATNLAQYDMLVQGCLATGSHCIIDIHNYARWNGGIIGQGGPTNDQFASLWSQLATKYASESRMVFGLVNEPHDLPDISTWGQSVQAAVTAIRQAGATSQIILLPGTDYTSAETFVSSGSAAALSTVTNIDGSTTNLIFEVHKYLDSDNSGTHVNCVSNQTSDSFDPFASYLRTTGRQALLAETGGGSSDATCLQYVCQELAYLEANSDVYLGYLGWAAGSFATDYVLSLTPFGSATTGWTDQELVTQCFATGGGASSNSPPPPAPISSTTPAVVYQAPSPTLSVSSTADAIHYSSSTTETTPTPKASHQTDIESSSSAPTARISSVNAIVYSTATPSASATLPSAPVSPHGTPPSSPAVIPTSSSSFPAYLYPSSTSSTTHHHQSSSGFSTVYTTMSTSSTAAPAPTETGGEGDDGGDDDGYDTCEL